MILPISLEGLSSIDLSAHARYVPEQYHFFYFGLPGVAPYRLLAHLSTQFTDQTLVEVGVHNGWGSLALGYKARNRVVGFDLDLSTLNPDIPKENPHLTFHQMVAHELAPALLLAAPLIHLDTLHDSIYEQTFVEFLTRNAYKGLLLCDDIHLNREMERFWNGIELPKEDLTHVGHSTGSGLVYFSS